MRITRLAVQIRVKYAIPSIYVCIKVFNTVAYRIINRKFNAAT